VLTSLAASATGADAPVPADRELAVIADYRQQPVAEFQPYSYWRWSPEAKASAGEFSRRAVVEGDDGGRHLLLHVSPTFPWSGMPISLHPLTSDYFPPESDAIVLRLRVVSGEFRLGIGGPTAYFGDSDVFTATQRIAVGDWTDVRFDLHEGLQRNYRRAGYGRAAQVMSYNRWAQEPTMLTVWPGSSGTLLVQSAKLVATGRGRPFPTFEAAVLESVRVVPVTLESAFTMLLADSQWEDFKASWLDPAACRYPPPAMAAADAPVPGAAALSATAGWNEEIRWAGLRTEPTSGADALAITVRVATDVPSTLLASAAGQPIDIGLLAAPAGEAFPWDRLQPPEEWRRDAKGKGYDLNLSHRVVGSLENLHVGLFHARRFIRPNEWQSFVIPYEDFACVGATGAFRERLVAHTPPTLSDASAAVLWLVPWPRRKPGGPATAAVADIRFLRIAPSDGRSRRSYPAPLPGTLPQETQP
jgi:hypothetical protein